MLIPAVAAEIGTIYILARLFFLIVAFNLAWSLFLAFLVAHVGGVHINAAQAVKQGWQLVPFLVHMMTYLKATRCISLVVTTISVKIARKYIIDKAYNAIFE